MAEQPTAGLLGKMLTGVDRLIEATIVILVLGMIATGALQVFCRYALNASLSWSEELQIYAHMWLVLLAVPVAYRKAMHLGMTALRDRLPAGVARSLTIAADLLWLGLAGILICYTPQLMARLHGQTSAGLQMPRSYVYACLLVSGVYLALCALRALTGHLRRGVEPPTC